MGEHEYSKWRIAGLDLTVNSSGCPCKLGNVLALERYAVSNGDIPAMDEDSIEITLPANRCKLCSQTDSEILSCMLEQLGEIYPSFGRLFFHAAAYSYRGEGYLVTAPSGTGKSTHMMLWKRFLGKEVCIINGDKPILHVDCTDADEKRSRTIIYSSPLGGKEGLHNNESAPLSGLCFIARGTTNRIRAVEPDEAVDLIMRQVYLPHSSRAMGCTLELIDGLLRSAPLYYLECDVSKDAVRCSFEAMTGISFSRACVSEG